MQQEAAAAAEAQLLRTRKEIEDLQSEVARLAHLLKEKATQVCCTVRADTLTFLTMQILEQGWDFAFTLDRLQLLFWSQAFA